MSPTGGDGPCFMLGYLFAMAYLADGKIGIYVDDPRLQEPDQ